MSNPDISGPHLEFTFTGVLALCVSSTKDHFDVGFIKDADRDGDIPHHPAFIEIKPDGQPSKLYEKKDMQKEMHLEILGQTTSNIQLFRPNQNFSRDETNDDHGHFDWIVDVEGTELNDAPVDINSQLLRSVLRVSRINGGVFFTGKLSQGRLHVKDNVQTQDIGIVGEIIKALIPLPSQGAILRNGPNDPNPFIFNGTTNYQILVSQHCLPGACDSFDTSDFYNALFESDRLNGKKRFFVPQNNATGDNNTAPRNAMVKLTLEGLAANSPDTGCPATNFSLTPELPPVA